MQGSFKRIRAGVDGHRSAPSDDTGQPPPHWNQSLKFTTDVQFGCELDIFQLAPSDDTGQPPPHWNQSLKFTTDVQSGCELDIFQLVEDFAGGDEESPACLKQIEEGGKDYKAEKQVQLTT